METSKWNFADDESEACDAILLPPPQTSATNGHVGERLWNFRVLMNDDMTSSEQLAVVGSCESLGNWQLSGSVIMHKDEGM